MCLIAKDQKASVCVDWDTGETTFGKRADSASPWKTRNAPPLEEAWASQPGPFQTLMSGFLNVIGMFGRAAATMAVLRATRTEPRSGTMIERRARSP